MSNDTLLALGVAVFTSTGLWKLIETIWTHKHHKKTAQDKLLLGLAFETIINTSQKYIDRGEIDSDEYKELNHYLFEPYKEMGGNGTAARMIAEVEKLPIKKGA